jgi:hypothetical protein
MEALDDLRGDLIGGGRLSTSSRLSSLSQVMSRLSLSRFSGSATSNRLNRSVSLRLLLLEPQPPDRLRCDRHGTQRRRAAHLYVSLCSAMICL